MTTSTNIKSKATIHLNKEATAEGSTYGQRPPCPMKIEQSKELYKHVRSAPGVFGRRQGLDLSPKYVLIRKKSPEYMEDAHRHPEYVYCVSPAPGATRHPKSQVRLRLQSPETKNKLSAKYALKEKVKVQKYGLPLRWQSSAPGTKQLLNGEV